MTLPLQAQAIVEATLGAWADALVAAAPSTEVAAIVFATFLLAGAAKGVVGFGLPTVALAVLAATFGLKAAIALTILPALTTNIWQGLAGGRFWPLSRRLGPVLIMIVIGIAVGTQILAVTRADALTVLLGVLVVVYAITGLVNMKLPDVGAAEVWVGPIVGVVNGVITGLSGTFILPGLLYLRSLGLERDALIQAMGIVFAVSTLAMTFFLARLSLLPPDLMIASAIAVPAAFFGMWIGQRVRRVLSDVGFDTVFYVSLACVGVFLIVRNSGALAAL